MNAHRPDIVITGTGLVSCFGLTPDAAWEAVCERRDAMRPFSLCESPLPAARTGGEAPDPPAPALPDEARETCLLRTAIDAALRQSRFHAGRSAPHRTAVVFGTTLHGMRRAGEFLRTQNPDSLSTFLAAPTLFRALRGLNISGPVLSNCSACSSGLGSIALAVTLLESGLADTVIAGGYDPICEYAIGGFGALRLLASGPLRPFCKGRDGMKLSEAYAALVLERADHAHTRGAEPLAHVRGYGESSDSHHLTQPHPEGAGAARAINTALSRAELRPEDIGLIAAHATGTPNNDASEFAAISAAFREKLSGVATVAFKSHLGHSLGAAGAAELILSLHALRHGCLPPTANIRVDDLEFPSLNLNAGPARAAAINSTINLSLGFGGANTCVVLCRECAPRSQSPVPSPTPARREVLITGIGIVLPGVVGMDGLRARVLDASPITRDTGSVPEDQYAHLINTRRVRRLSDYVKLTLATATDACRDAGIDDVPAFMASCHGVLGTMACSTSFCDAYYRQIVTEGIEAANPMLFAEGVPNAAAAHLSMALGITGSCQSIIGSRTAGLDALGIAFTRIAAGDWDRAVVSAGEEYHPIVNAQLRRCGLHSTPPGEPFASPRGASIGAGAVTIILESRKSAETRAARTHATIHAWAARSCVRGLAAPGGAETVKDAWLAIGAPRHALTSANGSWLDSIEADGLTRAALHETRVSSPAGHIAETLSVTPLVGLAALVATGSLPRLRGDSPRLSHPLHPSAAPKTVGEVGILCTDPSGPVSAVTVALP